MNQKELSRREAIRNAAILLAGAAMPASAFGLGAGATDGELIPFLDAQQLNPERPMVEWAKLTSWITPKSEFFTVGHYGFPEVKADTWRLKISGHVKNTKTYTLADLKARPKREIPATLECSGNGVSAGFLGGIGNAKWTGTPLVPILKEAGIQPEGIEVVFWAADSGTEKLRGKEYPMNFARSLSVADAMNKDLLLVYEMNGEPLSPRGGAPVRVVAPGWYGVAWVKWLTDIEVHDRRFEGRFMGRDYVTIRGEQQGEKTFWREMSVGKMNLKSIAARVVKRSDGTLLVTGAAWNDGTPLTSVDVQVDGGQWMKAKLGEGAKQPYCWTFWSFEWKDAKPGEHTIVSRATDARGRTQPAAEDDTIKLKRTYWEANQQYPRKIKV